MLFVGTDVGGTFTDVVIFDEESRKSPEVLKVPTNPKHPESAILEALGDYQNRTEQFALISHATTIATNSLLTKSGLAETALITNEGFRDVLEIGRQRRPEIYNLKTKRPDEVVKRKKRFTVKRRRRVNGSSLTTLAENDLRTVSRTIIERGIESVAISFLNSYVNPADEIKAEKILRHSGFKGHIDLSSRIDPQYKEYERTSTTVVNASLAPSVSQYLQRLKKELEQIGIGSPVYVMNSDGTASTTAQAAKHPMSIIESGPAAGVLSSRNLARHLSLTKAITFDMGGTTAKAGTIVGGRPDLAYEFEAAGRSYHGRSIKGSGYPVRQPFIDLAEVSAGGGTIAHIDETGHLKVGPESAGANPGPAAYGNGGTQATVTDANIVAGRINPSKLLGGQLKLRDDLAVRAVGKLRRRLGTSTEETADRILFSAFGLLTAEVSRTFIQPIIGQSAINIEPTFRHLREQARKSLKEEGFTGYQTVEQVDLRYQGQAYEITLPYKKNSNLARMLGREHKNLYGYSSKDAVEAVNARIRAIIPMPKAKLPKSQLKSGKPAAPASSRKMSLLGSWQKVPVYDQEKLFPGVRSSGPCIIEEYDSTTVSRN